MACLRKGYYLIMKRIVYVLFTLSLMIFITACSGREVTDKTVSDLNPGLFDNVSNVTIYFDKFAVHRFELGSDYDPYYLTFDDGLALNNFIERIKGIESAKQIKGKSVEYDADTTNEKQDEENLDISLISLVIEYEDDKEKIKISEFTDGNLEVFENGGGIRIETKQGDSYYENNDNVIIKTVIDMIKDTLHYVQVYDDDEAYVGTYFLRPLYVKTDEYTIQGMSSNDYVIEEYWFDYTSKNGFKIYQNDKRVEEMYWPNNKLLTFELIDSKGNVFQYAYDRVVARLKYVADEENIHKYYIQAEEE